MKVHFYTIYDDYRFTIESPIELDNIARAIDDLTLMYFEAKLYKAFPDLKNQKIEIRFEWLYDGYKLFIIGTQLTDFQISKYCRAMNDAQCVDFHTYLELPIGDYRKYTGITLGYDITNYYRLSVDRLIVYIPMSPFDAMTNIRQGLLQLPEELRDFFAEAKIYKDLTEVEIQKKKEEMQNGKTEYLYRTHEGGTIKNI